MKAFVRNDAQQPHQVFMLELPEENGVILTTEVNDGKLEFDAYKLCSDSRHNCGFLQEGLGCDITFNDLYCHPLAHVLSFKDSWGGQLHQSTSLQRASHSGSYMFGEKLLIKQANPFLPPNSPSPILFPSCSFAMSSSHPAGEEIKSIINIKSNTNCTSKQNTAGVKLRVSIQN